MTATVAFSLDHSMADIVPAELLFGIAEHVCWDSDTGWDARRLVPFAQSCRFVFTSVRPLVRSSLRGSYPWKLERVIHSLLKSDDYRAIRSISIIVNYHECKTRCTGDASCIVAFIAMCSQFLVQLELFRGGNMLLYDVAHCVGSFPRLRYLKVGNYEGSIKFSALAAIARCCPALEILEPIIMRLDENKFVPKMKAPFRLRSLHLYGGAIDVAVMAWMCGDTLRHLILDNNCSKLLDEMEGVRKLPPQEMEYVVDAKNVLAALPRLTIRWPMHRTSSLERLLRYTPQLLHLEAEMGALPSLNCLPSSLQSLRLVIPRKYSDSVAVIAAFIASLPRERPSGFSAVISFDALPQESDLHDQLISACIAVGLCVSSS